MTAEPYTTFRLSSRTGIDLGKTTFHLVALGERGKTIFTPVIGTR